MLVIEFVEACLEWARARYVKSNGRETGQARNLEIALRWWRGVDKDVSEVVLADLQAYRTFLVDRRLATRTVNQYVGWTRGAFRWGAEEQLVPSSVAAELMVLRPLRVGAMREAHRRGAVELEDLRRVAAYLDKRGRTGAMMRVQWLAGARPGEVRRMQWKELQERGDLMIFRPGDHKVEHFGLHRVLVLVPEAVRLLGAREEGAVFKSRLGREYSPNGYAQELARACRALKVRHITPASIRRAAATAARAMGGAEAAQRLLGHTSTAMTEDYFDLGWLDTVEEVQKLRDCGWAFDAEPQAD